MPKQSSFVDDLLRAYGLVIAVLFMSLIITFYIGVFDQADAKSIQSKCVEHQGVQQVVTSNWEAIDGRVTVVCKDGKVVKVK